MLQQQQIQQVQTFLQPFSKEELTWINGYITGLLSPPNASSLSTNSSSKKLTITYGTETGNSKKVATNFAAKAKQKGIATKLIALDQYKLQELEKEEYFVTVISTQGEGEPPETAKKFHTYIHENAKPIPNVNFGVLALGDTAYPLFCKTGEEVDNQLSKLGANRFVPLQKCDVDYDEDANAWFEKVLINLHNNDGLVIAKTAEKLPNNLPEKKAGKTIHTATILANYNLTANGSNKQTYHIELAAEHVNYLPGDSIAIVPENNPQTVKNILEIVQLKADEKLTWKSETDTIYNLLLKKISISFLLEKAIKQYAEISTNTLNDGRVDLLFLLKKYPINTQQFLQLLPSLSFIAPRIYNIASSPNAHNNQVHIIALQHTFSYNQQNNIGLCTAFFERKKVGDTIEFFVQPNKRFRLPENDKDIIMIGPGTGIAPFRSFIAERDTVGATGKNWLFFSEENFITDFYYQTEWQNWYSIGTLTHMNVAFAQGQYQQTLPNKLLQKSKQIFEWLQQGAYLYLCGEKDPLGKEIEATILQIIQQESNSNVEEAKAYFENLKQAGRYMKDVY